MTSIAASAPSATRCGDCGPEPVVAVSARWQTHLVRVLVAMSGGVDSSVAASLLVEQGHEVSGVTLKLWGGSSDSGCCSVADVADAARVASQLGIAHHVANLGDEFDDHVVRPYVTSHLIGETPNPCIECNRHIKFGRLLEMSDRLGFDALATGHHARVITVEGAPSLRRGVDPGKDQSYVLSMLVADQLGRILLPVGELTKAEVRAHARARGLRSADKAESQEVCFISSERGRRGFLEEHAELTPGRLVDVSSGLEVGTIDAVELVTVGQKRRMGVDVQGQRRVAVRVDINEARVLVASPLMARIRELSIDIDQASWVDGSPPADRRVLVQLRAHAEAVPALIVGGSIELEDAIDPVAPGQTAAFFSPRDPGRVLGSATVQP